MKDIRPFEEIFVKQASDRLSDQTRLSIMSRNAGLKRGKVTNCVVDVVLLQEAESHFHEIAENAAEQFHMYHGADQLILFHNNTFDPGGVETEGKIPGPSKQYFLL